LTSQMQKVIDHLLKQKTRKPRPVSPASSSSSSAWSSEDEQQAHNLTAVVTDDEIDHKVTVRQKSINSQSLPTFPPPPPVNISSPFSARSSTQLAPVYASEVRKRLHEVKPPLLCFSPMRNSLTSRFSVEKAPASPLIKGSTGSAPPSAEPTAVRPSLLRSSASSMFTFSSLRKSSIAQPASSRPSATPLALRRSLGYDYSSESDDFEDDEDDEATRRILAKYAKLALSRN
jgi:hypothetical protein